MRELAMRVEEPTSSNHRTVIYHRQVEPELQRLQAKLDDMPASTTKLPKRAKGWRERIIGDLAAEHGLTPRQVVRYINKL